MKEKAFFYVHIAQGGYDHAVIMNCRLELGRGEFCCIVGPNGSGKSTFLKSIIQLLPLNESEVMIEGVNIAAMPVRQRARHLSYMLQKLEISFPFTVEELVKLGRYPHSHLLSGLHENDLEIVTRAMEKTGSLPLRDRRVNELSGGEYQRVLLAKTLAQETPILLLDEPTAHMDLAHQVQTYELLKDLSINEGKTVLTVCHDLNLASEFADQVAVIDEGGIIAFGPPKDTLTGEKLRFLAGFKALKIRENPFTGNPHIYIHPQKLT